MNITVCKLYLKKKEKTMDSYGKTEEKKWLHESGIIWIQSLQIYLISMRAWYYLMENMPRGWNSA